MDFEKLGNVEIKLDENDYESIRVYENTEADIQKLRTSRAKQKRETKRLIDKYYKEIEQDRE